MTGTGNHLQKQFQPRVQALEEEYRRLLVDQPPKGNTIPTPVSPGTGPNSDPPLKVEQSPGLSLQDLPKSLPLNHSNGVHQSVFMSQHGVPQHQPQSPLTYQPQWAGGYSLLPQPQSQGQLGEQATTLTSPIYSTFSRAGISGLSTPGSYPSVPTSLAPLLKQSGNYYVSYPTPPQTHVNTGGTSTSGGDLPMTFSASHYFDGPGPLTWPSITMPPGQQL